MGIAIAALGALLLSALSLFFNAEPSAAARFALIRDGGVILLSLYIAGRSLLAMRTAGQPAPARPAAPEVPAAPEAPAVPAPAAPAVAAAAAAAPAEPAKPRVQPPPQTGEALILLSLLQEKGRFLDYLMEDVSTFSDAQVAAASRVVHQGCAAVIRECLALAPAHGGKEGERITIDAAADPQQYRLIGKVAGTPPFSGVVVHRGWKTSKLALPRHMRPIDPNGLNVITPVEVEVR
jgi:hypothetical protein